MKHVVVVGGGFAGVGLARRLAKDAGTKITFVDRNNYCFFPPLLYQVATGFLESANIAYPFRKLFRGRPNIRFRMAELLRVIPERNVVQLSTGELGYDVLVLATGLSTNYFGMNAIRERALPMKNLDDALNLRNHMLEQLERATQEENETEQAKRLTVVIAGNGPTGVELAGMLANMQRDILYRDSPELRESAVKPRIILVDGNSRVLNAMSPVSSQYTQRVLERLGVEVKFGLMVKDYSDDRVVFNTGEVIETKTLIWAAGVTGQRFEGLPAAVFGPGGRIKTDPFNCVVGFDNIYAIGDCSLQTHEAAWPNGHPQMAQIAIQQGKTLAHNLRMKDPRHQRPFHYFNKGSMAMIGRNRAVVDMPRDIHMRGLLAFFAWLGVHLVFLWRGRNRVTTLFNWAVAYLTRDASLRMIIRPKERE
jgi:NADH dehydrogenase